MLRSRVWNGRFRALGQDLRHGDAGSVAWLLLRKYSRLPFYTDM